MNYKLDNSLIFKKIMISITLLLILILSGCNIEKQSAYGKITNSDLIDEETSEILIPKINKSLNYKPDEAEIEITDVNNLEKIKVITFLSKKDNDKNYGFLLTTSSEKNAVNYVDFEYAAVHKQEPFELFNYVGNIELKLGQKINITTGYINDKNISDIYVYYTDSKMSVLKLEDGQKTFSEISLGGEAMIETIVALSKEGDIIHEIKQAR